MGTKIVHLRDSAQIAEAGTTTGDPVKLQEIYHRLSVLLDVTALGGTGSDTLDVYVDASPDGGTTWLNIGRFTQKAGGGSAEQQIIEFHESQVESTQPVDVTADLSSAGTRQVGFFDRLRYRGVVAGAGADFTYSVKAFLK